MGIIKIITLSRQAFFACGKMTNLPKRPYPPYPDYNNILKGPAHLVYFITLNLSISASRQNNKIWSVTLEPSTWGLFMPNFRPLVSLVREENEVTDALVRHAQPLYKISKLPFRFASRGKINQLLPFIETWSQKLVIILTLVDNQCQKYKNIKKKVVIFKTIKIIF